MKKFDWGYVGNKAIDKFNSFVALSTNVALTIIFIAWYTGHLKVVQMTDQLWMISIH